MECIECPGGSNNVDCGDRETLIFDLSYQYPHEPVCGLPLTTGCEVSCDVNDDDIECCSYEDCPNEEYCESFKCDIVSTTTEEIGTTGSGCLPFDGSVTPDCLSLVDSEVAEPVYAEHSTSMLYIS